MAMLSVRIYRSISQALYIIPPEYLHFPQGHSLVITACLDIQCTKMRLAVNLLLLAQSRPQALHCKTHEASVLKCCLRDVKVFNSA